jgi:DNA polymerase-4
MQELLGKNGLKIWKKANGIDQSPVIPYSSRKSVSTERTFDKDTQNIPELKSLLVVMIEKTGLSTAKYKYNVLHNRSEDSLLQTVILKLCSKKLLILPNDDILIKVASELFDKLYHRRMLLRLVGVKLSGLVPGASSDRYVPG